MSFSRTRARLAPYLEKDVADGFQLRAYLDKEQKSVLRRWIGCQRFVRNAKVQEDRYYRKFQRKFLPIDCYPPVDQQYARFITEDSAFLKEVPWPILRNGAVVFAQAYQRFFKGAARRPTIKKKHGKQSVWLTSELYEMWRDEDGKLRLTVGTKKCPVGEIKLVEHRRVTVLPKSIRITVEGDMWHCTFGLPEEYPYTPTEKEMIDWYSSMSEAELSLVTVGIDRGVAVPFADSMGNMFDYTPEQKRNMAKAEKAQAKWQRTASRRKNGSVGKKKALDAAARQSGKQKRIRNDFTHKASHTTAADPRTQVIVFEDLKIKNMTASAAGTVEEPGKKVAQKRGLNKSILNAGWGMFKQKVAYKAARRGKLVIVVDPKNTSRECPICDLTSKDNRVSQSDFVCQACAFTQNADTNAAGITKRRGVKALLAGGIKPKEKKSMRIKRKAKIGTEDPESTLGESLSASGSHRLHEQCSPNQETPA